MPKRRTLPSLAIVALAVPVVLGLASLFFLRRGTADRKDGIPVVARVARAADGSCVFGAKREHCYRLSLEVLPAGAPPFQKQLDVLVPDRHAARVQPGAYVWVVQNRLDPKDVLLALEAFDEPAPTPSAAP